MGRSSFIKDAHNRRNRQDLVGRVPEEEGKAQADVGQRSGQDFAEERKNMSGNKEVSTR